MVDFNLNSSKILNIKEKQVNQEGTHVKNNNNENVEKDDLEFEKINELKIENQNQFQNIGLRKEYAKKIFILICAYLIVVTVFIAESLFFPSNRLSDSVLITLLSTTTITVVGLFVIVTKYLFNPTK